MSPLPPSAALIDRFGRRVTYLRVSITDRCDFRCIYCMAEDMEFLPRSQILSLEEIETVCRTFVELGVDKIRITGGEPLVRKGALGLLRKLGGIPGLRELALTTNGSQLETTAQALKQAGVKRVNISLDTLNPELFRKMTRIGDLEQILRGVDAAITAGFARVKLNAVILKNRNHQEVCDLVEFAANKGIDISFIEEMPLGLVDGHDRAEEYYSSDAIWADLGRRFSLLPSEDSTGGPSRYFKIVGTDTRVGLISPHSHNFCSSCNRVRLTAEGRLLLCLGNEHSVDLKHVLRTDPASLKDSIIQAMPLKPKSHEFDIQEKPVIFRHMNVTGG